MNIRIEDVEKVKLRVGQIMAAGEVEGSEKLLREVVSFGEETKIVFSGIKKWYRPEELIGKKVVFVVNLEPRKMPAIEKDESGNPVVDEKGEPKHEYSQAMIIAADAPEGKPVLIGPIEDVPAGVWLH